MTKKQSIKSKVYKYGFPILSVTTITVLGFMLYNSEKEIKKLHNTIESIEIQRMDELEYNDCIKEALTGKEKSYLASIAYHLKNAGYSNDELCEVVNGTDKGNQILFEASFVQNMRGWTGMYKAYQGMQKTMNNEKKLSWLQLYLERSKRTKEHMMKVVSKKTRRQ
jgi:hypothetical protein